MRDRTDGVAVAPAPACNCGTGEQDRWCPVCDGGGVAGPLAEQCAEHGECTEKAMGEPECAGRCKAHERALGVEGRSNG